jgi:hypothetical protein
MRRIIIPGLLLLLSGCAVGTTPDDPQPLSPEVHVQGQFDAYSRTSAPTTCAANEDAIDGKCYAQCKAGYSPFPASLTICGTTCPSGYTDEGGTCYRPSYDVSANTNGCPSQTESCFTNLFLACSVCPAGFIETDGCKCTMPPETITKTTYDRSGTGAAFDTCATGEVQDGTVCYATCKAGFHAAGPLCMKD